MIANRFASSLAWLCILFFLFIFVLHFLYFHLYLFIMCDNETWAIAYFG